MPKMLITDTCIVNYNDDRGGVAEQAASIVDVSRDTALALVRAHRALYTNKADDPDKTGRNTASKDEIALAAQVRADRDAADKAASKEGQGE